jgi:NTP pyrophosphatase (non-canonical NTP hydrolase)
MSDIFQKALDHFGKDNQLRKMQEECAELIIAINHKFNNRKSAESAFLQELVDVEIVLSQMKLLVDEYMFEAEKKLRLQKLDHRIKCKENDESYK